MKPATNKRVLALNLHTLNFGFVVFEGPDVLVDWGIKNFRNGVNAVKVPQNVKLEMLFDQWEPHVVITNKASGASLEKIVCTIGTLASTRNIPVQQLYRTSTRGAFPEANHNKYQIAASIAQRFPELAPRLGERPKLWQSERYEMGVFDAVALGVAYFSRDGTPGSGMNKTSSPLPR